MSSPFNKATRVPESDPYNVRQSGQGNSTKVEMVVVDLSSQSSVRFAAREIASLTSHIDILLNNAGVSLSRGRSLSPEGIEQTFATNHVGHFLLTTLLLPLLQSAPSSGAAARVVNVSSLGHRLSPVRFSDINFDNEVEGPRKGKIDVPKDELPRWERLPAWSVARAPDGFPGPIAYGMSKSANILFTIGLKTRGIASLAVHPGGESIPILSFHCAVWTPVWFWLCWLLFLWDMPTQNPCMLSRGGPPKLLACEDDAGLRRFTTAQCMTGHGPWEVSSDLLADFAPTPRNPYESHQQAVPRVDGGDREAPGRPLENDGSRVCDHAGSCF